MQKNILSKVAQNAVECDNAIELRLNCQLIDASQLFASNAFPQLVFRRSSKYCDIALRILQRSRKGPKKVLSSKLDNKAAFKK